MVRQTHTFAKLEISKAAYDEIAAKLRAVQYDHVFIVSDGDQLIDMHGIALALEPTKPDAKRPN